MPVEAEVLLDARVADQDRGIDLGLQRREAQDAGHVEPHPADIDPIARKEAVDAEHLGGGGAQDSAEFRKLRERHDVAVRHISAKTLVYPQIGPLELECEVLLSVSGAGEQSLVMYTARPGTDAAGKLELLRVLGRETFADGKIR
jgi:MmyB-like transcription regulator ligand binding domain